MTDDIEIKPLQLDPEKSRLGYERVATVGAAIPLTEEVQRLGILFTHPLVEPFILHINVDDDGNMSHRFIPLSEVAEPAEVDKAKLIMPDKKIIT